MPEQQSDADPLSAIRARLAKATPGPWREGIGGNTRIYGPDNTGDAGLVASFVRRADVAFVTHAREDIPTLLALYDELRNAVAGVGIAHELLPHAYMVNLATDQREAEEALNRDGGFRERAEQAEAERDAALARIAALEASLRERNA